jgi:hypothetical protein
MDVEIALGSFYTQKDEDRFFQALKENKAIKKMEGAGVNLIVSLEMKKLSNDELKDFLALLYRYQIPLAPLYFLADRKRFSWLNDSKKYWFDSLFDETKRTRSRLYGG